jgi:hypothetical protein
MFYEWLILVSQDSQAYELHPIMPQALEIRVCCIHYYNSRIKPVHPILKIKTINLPRINPWKQNQ